MIPMARLEGMARRLVFHGVPQLVWVDATNHLDACPAAISRARLLLANPPRGYRVIGVFKPGVSAAELARQVRAS